MKQRLFGCRQLRDATLDGTLVSGAAELTFLVDLFGGWHDEWDERVGRGFVGSTTITVHAHGAPTAEGASKSIFTTIPDQVSQLAWLGRNPVAE